MNLTQLKQLFKEKAQKENIEITQKNFDIFQKEFLMDG